MLCEVDSDDPIDVYKEKLKAAMDAQTDELLADYIKNHLLSRGAPVGSC
jgi:hypothetical protein